MITADIQTTGGELQKEVLSKFRKPTKLKVLVYNHKTLQKYLSRFRLPVLKFAEQGNARQCSCNQMRISGLKFI